MAKKKFSMTETTTAVKAFKESQEKPEKEQKKATGKKAEKQTKPKEKKTKLPAAEIERMKTDFDPPRVAVDPGQTELFADDKKSGEKPKKQMGQPRKYEEPLRRISFALPESAVEKMEALAAIQKINKTQFLLSMIEKAAKESADKIEKYKEL